MAKARLPKKPSRSTVRPSLPSLEDRLTRAKYIQKELKKLYPKPEPPLHHTNPFTLLVAVLMSARMTDIGVNKVTPELFRRADSAEKMTKIPVEEILKMIKTIGLAPTKAKNIHRLSEILVEKFDGKVPQTFEELEELPGVGHKTASVVMSQAFGFPAFPVDTHIHRLAERWKLSNGKTVEKTEADLKEVFPKKTWNDLHLQIIYYGREHCAWNQCDGLTCKICEYLNT